MTQTQQQPAAASEAKHCLIHVDMVNELLKYLRTKPMDEVEPIVAALRRLQKIELQFQKPQQKQPLVPDQKPKGYESKPKKVK